MGIVIALVVAVAVGWIVRSYGVGLGVFLAGYAVAVLWGRLAGERFRARQWADPEREDGGPDPDSEA